MVRAQIVDTWVVNGDGLYLPLSGLMYDLKWVDVTGQSGQSILDGLDPDSFVIEVECDEATYDLIAESNDFVVLWSEDM